MLSTHQRLGYATRLSDMYGRAKRTDNMSRRPNVPLPNMRRTKAVMTGDSEALETEFQPSHGPALLGLVCSLLAPAFLPEFKMAGIMKARNRWSDIENLNPSDGGYNFVISGIPPDNAQYERHPRIDGGAEAAEQLTKYSGQEAISQHQKFTGGNSPSHASPYGMVRRDGASNYNSSRATPANHHLDTPVGSAPTPYDRFLRYEPPAYASPYVMTDGSRTSDQNLPQAMPEALDHGSRRTYEQMPASDQPRRWICCFSKTAPEWMRHASAWMVGTNNMCAARSCIHRQCPDCLLESIESVPDEIRGGDPIENAHTFYNRWAAMDDNEIAHRTEMYTETMEEEYKWGEDTAGNMQAGTDEQVGGEDLASPGWTFDTPPLWLPS
ncbi:unnamed protein product [Diplocarpon coronariae]